MRFRWVELKEAFCILTLSSLNLTTSPLCITIRYLYVLFLVWLLCSAYRFWYFIKCLLNVASARYYTPLPPSPLFVCFVIFNFCVFLKQNWFLFCTFPIFTAWPIQLLLSWRRFMEARSPISYSLNEVCWLFIGFFCLKECLLSLKIVRLFLLHIPTGMGN